MRTHAVIILDRSGSMQGMKDDHVGGLRSFVDDQKKNNPDAIFTLVQFDDKDPFELIYDAVPITTVGELNLVPRGGTPLLDAVGKTIAHLKSRVDEAIVVMVITDGHENWSKEWTRETLSKAVKEQEAAGWQFLFLGAGIDAFAEARGTGFSYANTASVSNTSQGVVRSYNTVSAKFASYSDEVKTCGGVTLDCAEILAFTDQDRSFINEAVSDSSSSKPDQEAGGGGCGSPTCCGGSDCSS